MKSFPVNAWSVKPNSERRDSMDNRKTGYSKQGRRHLNPVLSADLNGPNTGHLSIDMSCLPVIFGPMLSQSTGMEQAILKDWI